MKNIITGLLLAFISLNTSAQSIEKMRAMGSQEWVKALDKLEMMCALPQENWVNTVTGGKPWHLENQLVFILIGDFENPKSLENLRALNRMQFVLSHVKVIFIHQSDASYPTDLASFQNELNRFDIGILACMDTTNAIACFPKSTEPKTILIAPKGQIMGEITGWHDVDKLIQIATQFTNLTMDVYNFPHKPFYGSTPSQKHKTPLIKAPIAIASESMNNRLFVSDYMGNRVLVLSEFGQLLDVIGNGRPFFKDGEFHECALNGPRGLAVDAEQNALYIADARNRRIRKVSLIDLETTTVLGNGQIPDADIEKIIGNEQAMPYPIDIAIDGNDLYFSTSDAIWKMDIRTLVAEKISGDSLLNQPHGLQINGREVLCANTGESEFIFVENGIVTPLISTSSGPGYQDGKKEVIQFDHPMGSVYFENELFIADQYNHVIRKFNTNKLKSKTYAGSDTLGYTNGTLSQSKFYLPTDITVLNNALYIVELGNNTIRKIDSESGLVSTIQITEYESLCIGYNPPIKQLNDGPVLKIVEGTNTINLQFDLGKDYKFDPNGKSYVEMSTRKRGSISILDDDLNDGKIAFNIEIESTERPTDVTIDMYLYIKENKPDGRSYFKSTAYIISLDAEAKADLEPSVLVKIDQ